MPRGADYLVELRGFEPLSFVEWLGINLRCHRATVLAHA
jgi:hypothetical protein